MYNNIGTPQGRGISRPRPYLHSLADLSICIETPLNIDINVIQPMTVSPALLALLPEASVHRWNAAFMDNVLRIAPELLQEIPVYCLTCRSNYGAVQLLCDTRMKEGIV